MSPSACSAQSCAPPQARARRSSLTACASELWRRESVVLTALLQHGVRRLVQCHWIRSVDRHEPHDWPEPHSASCCRRHRRDGADVPADHHRRTGYPPTISSVSLLSAECASWAVWAQYLGLAAGAEERTFDFAVIGATIDNDLVDGGEVPSLVEQVDTFRDYFAPIDSEVAWSSNGTLFTLFFGVNDMCGLLRSLGSGSHADALRVQWAVVLLPSGFPTASCAHLLQLSCSSCETLQDGRCDASRHLSESTPPAHLRDLQHAAFSYFQTHQPTSRP